MFQINGDLVIWASQKYPKIKTMRRCCTILPNWVSKITSKYLYLFVSIRMLLCWSPTRFPFFTSLVGTSSNVRFDPNILNNFALQNFYFHRILFFAKQPRFIGLMTVWKWPKKYLPGYHQSTIILAKYREVVTDVTDNCFTCWMFS